MLIIFYRIFALISSTQDTEIKITPTFVPEVKVDKEQKFAPDVKVNKEQKTSNNPMFPSWVRRYSDLHARILDPNDKSVVRRFLVIRCGDKNQGRWCQVDKFV